MALVIESSEGKSLICAMCPCEIIIAEDEDEYLSKQAVGLPLWGKEVMWFCGIKCAKAHPRYQLALEREEDDELYEGRINGARSIP